MSNEVPSSRYTFECVEFFKKVYTVELESRKLRGKVKRIESLNHSTRRIIINEYDINGKRTESMIIMPYGDTVLQDLRSFDFYPNPEFYPCGLLRKTTESEFFGGFYKLYDYSLMDSSITITEYDHQDSIRSKEVRKYNELGQNDELWSFYPNGERHYSFFKFNSYGDIFVFNDIHLNGDSILNTNKYYLEYDSIGNKIKDSALFRTNVITSEITYH